MPREKKQPNKTVDIATSTESSAPRTIIQNPPESEVERNWYDYLAYLPNYVILGQSSIPGAGIGVFATKDIPADTVLGEYAGIKKPANTSGEYAVLHPAGFAVDAKDTRYGTWPRFINTYQWGGKVYALPNMKFTSGMNIYNQHAVMVQTTKDIFKGQELFLDYGPKYDYHGPYIDIHTTINNNI